ncbi:hypothetical protein [Bacillus marinisedimentorum]|uniref:hypothetical protein n=1 Tax=Bacillus marinisedimentorum TaxID=1821260 RepID=UPI0007DEB2B9|nr:hypothetical protein [Bacillus marinisedimentorum]
MALLEMACYILAAGVLLKVFFGLFFHERFYSWLRSEYVQEGRSWTIDALAAYLLLILALIWFGIFFEYAELGWWLAPLLTAAAMMTTGMLLDWRMTSMKFVRFIDKKGVKGFRMLNVSVLFIGSFFFYICLFLF